MAQKSLNRSKSLRENEIFYRLYLEKDKKKVELHENEVKKKEKELENCTFKPVINENS
jgi:hypothetical protein